MSEWQPIETAPDNDGYVLFFCALNGRYGLGRPWGEESMFETGDAKMFRPTHWMPLPEPPK